MNLKKTLMTTLHALALCACSSGNVNGYAIEKQDVAGGSAFYEIFVGSFCDSNGDGIGDLRGIESKLDYLKDLGVSYLWLTPVHPSPSYHKYDVKDYYAIDPSFGTLADFDSLVKSAKDKGIGIIMDMVFNHTSVQSEWFDKFCKATSVDDPYATYYSTSRSAKAGYTYINKASAYVETNFSPDMPELNLKNPNVIAELVKVQDYWLEKGVAGFRYDAVVYYFCENVGGKIVGDTEKNVAVMRQLADAARAKKSDVYLVGEAWVDDQNTIASYAGSTMNAFNFPTSGVDGSGTAGEIVLDGGPSAFSKSVVEANKKIKEANPNGDLCFFVSNHDQDRWGSFRSGRANDVEARKVIASAYLLTPGTPFMYYGEEISMLGTRTSKSTDAERRQAMVWGEGEAMCKQPENVTVPTQVEKGVKESLEDGWSTLNHYRKVLSIRNKYKDVFRKGSFEPLNFGYERACGFKITENGQTYYLVHNCYKEALTLKVEGATAILENIETTKSSASLKDGSVTIPAFSSVFMR